MDFRAVSRHILRLEVNLKIIGPLSIPVSVWLVRSDEGWIMVDAGPPATADHVVAAVARATEGRGPRLILLTHAHYDHSGGLNALRLAWNTPIACHVEEVPFITGEMEYRDLQPRGLAFWLGRYLMPSPAAGLPVSRDLQRGESIAGMVTIHLPGHSPGQIGFLHPQDQAILCGDALMNLRGQLSPPFAAVTPDPERARASMRRLAELDFVHLLPSHGEPILGRGREALLRYLGLPANDVHTEPW